MLPDCCIPIEVLLEADIKRLQAVVICSQIAPALLKCYDQSAFQPNFGPSYARDSKHWTKEFSNQASQIGKLTPQSSLTLRKTRYETGGG